jgi:RimJ/RimL family protein N-acetyltransferase
LLIIYQINSHQLTTLLEQSQCSEIDGLVLPENEEIAPRFVLERMIDQLNQDPNNSFWWLPWMMVVDQRVVGMCSFKNPPDHIGSVEIGYGMVPSQQRRGYATKAINLLLQEGFAYQEIQEVVAYTDPLNSASQRVLEKNNFVKTGSKVDPKDGTVWTWQKAREMHYSE